MSDIICVTNRKLCREDFLRRIGKMASAHPAGIILREKNLSEAEYEALSRLVLDICRRHNVPCLLHGHIEAAVELGVSEIHLPLSALRLATSGQKEGFKVLGASCHSVEEAREAYELGCTYIIAGHIFDTDCKAGLPGRGLDFLRLMCESVDIPVYAIGGITPENIGAVRNAGAAGACVMSGCMECDDIREYLKSFKEPLKDIAPHCPGE